MDQSAPRIGSFLALALQLGLLVVIVYHFQIESDAFLLLSGLTFAGFCVHYFLPFRFRLPFFLLLSLAGILWIFGAFNGAALIGMGLALIGICHLPVPFRVRVILLLAAGAALAAVRVNWIPVPWSGAVLPILGSMFMFRLIVYLYDLRHDTAPFTWSRSLSYFFLLPNVCFPLFPVVDYKTFRRNYYDRDADQIHQRGLQWMFRGITHLLLYRFVYYHLSLSAADVAGPTDLIRFLVTNFLLYLNVSGQFHLIIGMLHLFGFRLPETNHFYYLASSFNDFWRRINIYWKDFMMKVVYYPTFFKLKKLGGTRALILSTAVAFLITWLLHSYQWFWLRGDFPIVWQDGFYWGILGVLVILNSLYEAKYGRKRSLGGATWTPLGAAGRAAKVLGTFTVVCVLWSMWTSDSLSQWFSLWRAAGGEWTADAGLLPALTVAALAMTAGGRPGGGKAGGKLGGGKLGGGGKPGPSFARTAAINTAWIAGLLILGMPAVYSRLGDTASEWVHSVRETRLNRKDAALLEQGYYENLTGPRGNSQLWEIYSKQPLVWFTLGATDAIRHTGDFLRHEMVPNKQVFAKGHEVTSNRWGMRDKDYEMEKPSDTYRIALIGSSIVLGSGVGDTDTFEWVLEERLNRELAPELGTRFEILNFSVGGYSAIHQPMVLRDRVPPFEPDAVIYVAHMSDPRQTGRHLAERIREGFELPFPFLREVAEEAGIDADTDKFVADRKLRPHNDELVAWAYRKMAEEIRAMGATPIWVFLQILKEAPEPGQVEGLFESAGEAGFLTVDLRDVYGGRDEDSLIVAEWDFHPNATGHRLIADRLYGWFEDNTELLTPAGAETPAGELAAAP